MTSQCNVLVMAGGTGGHVYPGLAVANRLIESGCSVEWLGTTRGLENEAVPKAGIHLHRIHVTGLRGRGLLGWLLAPFKLMRALSEAFITLRRVRPDVVLGFGGFASGPGGIAAWLLRAPLVIHEQNAIPGLTNRVLSRLATVSLEAFPQAFERRRGVRTTGNPVRPSIAVVPAIKPDGRKQVRVLVLGGSQGAIALNRYVPEALAKAGKDVELNVRHQCGQAHEEATKQCYLENGLTVSPEPFIEDMADAYAWADLVICRSGAMTVSEVAAAGRAALFIPFPFAVDDHQRANAEFLVRAGAAQVVDQSSVETGKLIQTVDALIANRNTLKAMGEKARNIAMPNALEDVTNVCLEVAHGR